MSKLTPKQEKFAKNVGLKDMTYSGAYRDAYNAENFKMESVNVEASKLMANPNILLRVDYYKEKKAQAIIKSEIYTYQDHMKELDEMKNIALTPNGENGKLEVNAALKATELKGKVSELYNFVNKSETDITSGGEVMQMPTIIVDNNELKFNVGEQIEED